MDNGIYNRLFEQIGKLPVIDTHEHLLWNEADRQNDRQDVLSEYLIHYLSSDILSSGMEREDFRQAVNVDGDIAQRWRIVEPWWEACRYTGYGRALDIAVQAIYGIDGVHAGTIEELNRRFLEGKAVGHYQRVLRDLCNIETSLLDVWTFHPETESPFFRYIWQPINYISPSEPEGRNILASIEQRYGIRVRGLDDWTEALQAEMDAVLQTNKVRVLKCAIAYQRTLRFEKVEPVRARTLFAEALRKGRERGTQELLAFPQELQDFMMHRVLEYANERNLTIQFHTGLLEGNGNVLKNSDPSLLNNLFLDYPNVDFDLFHIGYPYQGIACALAKMFPNVFLDMCWAHIISPFAAVTALEDFLDAVPYNKISAFGGDYLFPDGVYGHLHLSRQNVSRALADKVGQRVFDEEKALQIARALYYDNPKRIFKL